MRFGTVVTLSAKRPELEAKLRVAVEYLCLRVFPWHGAGARKAQCG